MLVFIADDQPEVRSALRLLLEQEQWLRIVGEAESTTELLAMVPQVQPNVVLLDWELPAMSRNALSTLRSRCPSVLIIAMSGRSEARQQSIAAGCSAFVSKGDPPERLLSVLIALAPDDPAAGY